MRMFDDVAALDATGQAELIRQRAIQPIELVDIAIERIERVNPVLNAITTKMYEQALEIASNPLPEGPFTGVPFLLKDFLAEQAGVRVTNSSNFLGDFIPTTDSELVKRYKKAGLIMVAKTNTPEMAIGVTTEPRRFGPTRNPWDTKRTPGGSSGGAAASVAAGIVPMAHGNDAGGSIRIPASCCGVFGLRPSRGRNPLGPNFGDLFSGMVSEHALTRSVRDSAILLDATEGASLGDPYPAPLKDGPYETAIRKEPRKLRIGFSTDTPLDSKLHPDCISAVKETASLCVDLGHHVDEISPSFDKELMWISATKVLGVGTAHGIRSWARRLGKEPTEDQFEPFVWAYQQKANEISAPEYLLAIEDIHRLTRDIANFFTDYDLWLTPTVGQPPVPLGTFEFEDGDPYKLRRKMASFVPYTYIANATGQPAMSIPLYWNEESLPIGSHFLGRHGDEATLFQIASQLEEASPWDNIRPPVSA